MANPFDRVINVKEEGRPSKEHIRTKVKACPDDRLHISFTLNKRVAERAVYLIIIAILAAMLYFNPSNSCVEKTEDVNAAAVALQGEEQSEVVILAQNESQEEEEAETEEAAVNESTEEEEETVEEPEEEGPVTTPFSTSVTFAIEGVNYETNGDDNPSKMKDISFMIKNNWNAFQPRLEVYWYDSSAPYAIKGKVRSTKIYRTIGRGEVVRYTIRDFDSTYFYPEEAEETIKLVLYNINQENLTKTVTREIPP
jgi:hypothetical protein